jgi:aminoglycoside phosphotransferase
MHDLVRELTQVEAPQPRLTRLPLDEGALIVALAPRSEALLWVAKTAYGPAACRRLRAEAWALERLAQQALLLNLPRLLAWRESTEGGVTQGCLVQTALPGRRRTCAWNPRRPWAELPAAVGAAADWLRRFQDLVDAGVLRRRRNTLAELSAEDASDAAASRIGGEYAQLLTALPRSVACSAGARATPVHGDFWMGNLLWQPAGRIGVVDWSGLSVGSAIEDVLTFMANLPCVSSRGRCSRLESWQALWFSPGRPRQLLRACAAAAGYSDSDARCAFYLFLAKRMRWELGLGLQTRSADDRGEAAREWTAIVAWLAERRFPDPFTPMPA